MKRNIKIKVLLALILMSVGKVMWGATVTWTPSSIFTENTKMTEEHVTSNGFFTISFRTDGIMRHDLTEYYASDKTIHFYVGNYIKIIAKEGIVITKVLLQETKGNSGGLRTVEVPIGSIHKSTTNNNEYWDGAKVTHLELYNNDKTFVQYIQITYETSTLNEECLSISQAQYATFYNKYPYFMPNGVDGYTISEAPQQGEITMNKTCPSGSYVPANTPLLIKGAEGEYALYSKTGATVCTIPSNNMLHGNLTKTSHSGEGTYYKLSYDNNGENLGFYIETEEGTSITNNAGKCYLLIPSTSSVKSISLSELEDNYILGVDYVTVKPQRQAYNIFGMPVKDDAKGIVIKNGKKYFNR